MTLTIPIGWWLLPAGITVALFTWASRCKDGGPCDPTPLLVGLAAIVGSLLAWLIWAVAIILTGASA